MSLVINHNLMAMNASRNLNSSYARLADSTRKLSSGLRIGTAADDAAGLAIRELMRADVSTLNQGVRNANDAISLIQTADGALQIIDEKLIRMKELAEQAATGTYDSVQRAIIDSEYQQMASEITRIANATDFNGIKLLDGTLSAEDMNNLGAYHNGNGNFIGNTLSLVNQDGDLNTPYFKVDAAGTGSEAITTLADLKTELAAGTPLFDTGGGAAATPTGLLNTAERKALTTKVKQDSAIMAEIGSNKTTSLFISDGTGKLRDDYYIEDPAAPGNSIKVDNVFDLEKHLANGVAVHSDAALANEIDATSDPTLDELTASVRHDTNVLGDAYNWNLTSSGPLKVHFGTGNNSAEDYYYIAIGDSTAAALGVGNSSYNEDGIATDGHNISTQENAQNALEALNSAIISKDNIRANLGAIQNRLENTINNITIQSENMQAAESRISDVNVSTEMTEFTRNQVLSNAAVSMLAQANQLPQMAMKLLG